MAASMVRPRFLRFLASSSYIRQIEAAISYVELTFSFRVRKRTLHMAENRHKNDKFNLSSQNRRKRKFRYDEKQKDLTTGKLQTFKLDSLPGETTNNTSNTCRHDALASTLKEAMSSLLEGNEVDPKLIDYNIEITKVKIAHDFGHVTFYWKVTEDAGHDENIERLLESNQNTIRLLLPSYHHLHISPRIVFARDKQAQYLADIDTLLMKSRQHSEE